MIFTIKPCLESNGSVDYGDLSPNREPNVPYLAREWAASRCPVCFQGPVFGLTKARDATTNRILRSSIHHEQRLSYSRIDLAPVLGDTNG